jgi:hypothetical protein
MSRRYQCARDVWLERLCEVHAEGHDAFVTSANLQHANDGAVTRLPIQPRRPVVGTRREQGGTPPFQASRTRATRRVRSDSRSRGRQTGNLRRQLMGKGRWCAGRTGLPVHDWRSDKSRDGMRAPASAARLVRACTHVSALPRLSAHLRSGIQAPSCRRRSRGTRRVSGPSRAVRARRAGSWGSGD